MPATLVLVATLVWAIPSLLESRLGNGTLARALLLAPIVAFTVYCLHWSNGRYATFDYALGQGADTMLVSNPNYDVRGFDVHSTVDFLRARMPPGATLLTLPDGLILNYWLRRPNPTRHIYFVPWSIAFAGGEAEVVGEIAAHPPDFIAVTDRPTEEYGYPTFGVDPEYGGQIMRWIKSNYRRERVFGAEPLTHRGSGILILSRIPSP